jgi:uncharacterized protein YqfA (UPF0365 family)
LVIERTPGGCLRLIVSAVVLFGSAALVGFVEGGLWFAIPAVAIWAGILGYMGIRDRRSEPD